MAKKKELPIDGLSPKNVEKIVRAIRQIWSWSTPRRLCIARATNKETGFAKCEKCGKVVAKVYPDHILAVGAFTDESSGTSYIERMFCPSVMLQALCGKCHAKKTREERKKK